MKDLEKTKYCLGLQIEHKSNGILIHQSTYVEKVLKQFNIDKAHPLNSPMIVRSLDAKKDPFSPKEENEALLDPEVPYLSAIGALLIYNTTLKSKRISKKQKKARKIDKH